MFPRICVCLVFLAVVTSAADSQLKERSVPYRDGTDEDFYVEDGSGYGEDDDFHSDPVDLESSGSGDGPDDEDVGLDDRTGYHDHEDIDLDPDNDDVRYSNNIPDVVATKQPERPVYEDDDNKQSNVVPVMAPNETPTSFFRQPGVLAAVVGGSVVGLLCAILLVMFIVYRMRKKDEGSYALDEPKRSSTSNSYLKNSREFYA